MPRKPNNISDAEIQRIRKKILKDGNVKISNPVDCIELSVHIQSLTGQYISASTLKRFFNFHKTTFKPSYDTIKILKEYIFRIQFEGNQERLSADIIKDFFHLRHFEAIEKSNSVFQAACRSIAIHLRANRKLFESVMGDLAKNPFGRSFYYELFPDYEILSLFQYKGYELYLKYENSHEGKLFGNSILFLKYFFQKDKNGMKKSWQEIEKNLRHYNIHPFVLGRVFQCKLIFQHFFEPLRITETVREIFVLEEKQPRNSKMLFREFPGFHYFCCDGLYHVNKFDDLIKLSTIALHDFKKYPEFVWKGYYDQLKIYKALGLSGKGEPTKAIKVIQGIKPDQFYFISRKYFDTLLNEVKVHLV